MTKLSVVLATKNEEKNIGPCLESVKKMFADLPAGEAGEIVVVDEYSSDKTRQIAKKYGAKVYLEPHHEIFHITKQKALEYATGDWILQLDADERVTEALAKEIRQVLELSDTELKKRKPKDLKKLKLFERHQKIIEERDGSIGKKAKKVVAFFVPRKNFFLGKPLIHAGVYPDGVIRLVKKGKARFPAKSVHEQMEIDGEVAWLFNDLEHHDSPTLKRYLERMNRYTRLHARELKQKKVPTNVFYLLLYTCYKPAITFLKLYIRHRGYLDGMRGFLWSFLSAFHFPIAYFKYYQGSYN
jgi:glycosyltransferase involved in cell wall biosynthesis